MACFFCQEHRRIVCYLHSVRSIGTCSNYKSRKYLSQNVEKVNSLWFEGDKRCDHNGNCTKSIGNFSKYCMHASAYVSLTCKTVDFFLDPYLVNKLCSENPSFGFQHCVIRTDRLYVDNGSYVYAWSDKLQRIERVSTPSINDFRNYPSASNSGHW